MRSRFAVFVFVAACFWTPVGAQAQTPPAATPAAGTGSSEQTAQSAPVQAKAPVAPPFWDRTELSGFVDFYVGYNFNTPASRQAQLRNFDVEHSSFTLSMAELALEKKPTADSRGGFRVDFDYGAAATMISASEPGGATYQNIGQAYLSYLPSAKLQVDFGKFSTPIGNEYAKPKDNWNYSRSLLFTLAEPYYHAGVRASYTASDHVALGLFLVNGWNDVLDNNAAKTVGAQIALNPTKTLAITQTYLGGPEQTNDNRDWRHLADTIVTYTVTPKVSLAMNYNYGRDTVAGSHVQWQGVAGYVRFQPNAWFALTPRAEYYDDRNGFTTGAAQRLKELTVTGELKHKDGVLMRIEYRRDVSNQTFFQRSALQLVKNQDTLTVGFVYAFSSKAQ